LQRRLGSRQTLQTTSQISDAHLATVHAASGISQAGGVGTADPRDATTATRARTFQRGDTQRLHQLEH
jgi:hypothetical protein